MKINLHFDFFIIPDIRYSQQCGFDEDDSIDFTSFLIPQLFIFIKQFAEWWKKTSGTYMVVFFGFFSLYPPNTF